MIGRLLRPNPPAEVGEWVRNTILTVDPAAAAFAVAAMRERPDRTGALSKINCPTLVLAGASDATIPVDECRSVAAALPRGRLEIIDDAGHLSNLENPQAFNTALAAFLAA
jgi:pimeloyl-ACP methyl ester carboxylesterase